MSLCNDFQKWTIVSMLAILTVCLVGMVNLVYGQAAVEEEKAREQKRQLERDKYTKMIQEDIKQHNATQSAVEEAMKVIDNSRLGPHEMILNYCYIHADRPNPVQELIDKGSLSEEVWKNETCKSVRELRDQLVR